MTCRGEIQKAIEFETWRPQGPVAVRRAVDGPRMDFPPGRSIAIPYSYQNPYDVVQTNVLGTSHVLDACLANSVLERLVLTSTSEVYGIGGQGPDRRAAPAPGAIAVRATKIAADASW